MRFSLTLFFFIFTDGNQFFWARQMFGAIEQSLNEQTTQIVEFKKEQAADKAELKKNMRPKWLNLEPYY